MSKDLSPNSLARVIRVAGLQLSARPGAIADNLAHATPFVEQAVQQGAQLVVLPELYSSGYYLTRAIWDAAELPNGPTISWLKTTAHRFGIYLGVGFLEVDGDDFINTFALSGPDGEIIGRVKKREAESYFFKRVQEMTHVVETPIGRLGIGICADNHFVALPRRMQEAEVDLVLMPHASPAPSRPGKHVKMEDVTQARTKISGMAPLYSHLLGVPALFVNQVGAMGVGAARRPGILFKLLDPDQYRLVGLSNITDFDGQVRAQLGPDEEGLVVADVTLDPAQKVRIPPRSHGGWLHPGSTLLRRLILPIDNHLGALVYQLDPERKRKARAIRGFTAGQ